MAFDLSQYETVAERLEKFWTEYPDGRVLTKLQPSDDVSWVVRAEVYREGVDERPFATGLAHEVIGQGNVNKTSALENCETSAIGRALANGHFAPKGDPAKRASREEMEKVERGAPAQIKAPNDAATDPQKKKIAALLRGFGGEYPTSVYEHFNGAIPDASSITKGEASKVIDLMQAAPHEPKAERVGSLRG